MEVGAQVREDDERMPLLVSPTPARPTSMKPERYFYSVAAITMLLITFAGFQPFYLAGEGLRGRNISPELFPLVLHGAAMTAWLVLFVVQSLLISVRNRKLHMKLGWSAVVIAPVITVSGYMVAVQSVRETPMLRFWGMDYRQFLLIYARRRYALQSLCWWSS